MFHIITKLEKNYNGFGNHLTCVWHYLSLGIIEAHSPGGRQGGGEQAPPDIGGLGTVLSPHKRGATQQFQEQPGHKFTELTPLNRFQDLRPHSPLWPPAQAGQMLPEHRPAGEPGDSRAGSLPESSADSGLGRVASPVQACLSFLL